VKRWLLALLAGCGGVEPAAPSPAERWMARVDWPTATEEAAEVLSGYLAVDTSNPPGREVDGGRYLAALLEREGIPTVWLPLDAERGNLVARLEGSGEEAPLCLMSHIDVATAEASTWARPPFSGLREEGLVWGRGALDMKGVGVAELLTLVWLKRLGVPLRRDVVLLAVADEEVGSLGARELAARHWDSLGCSHLLNEGGIGLRGGVVEGVTTYAISVAEKGSLWVRMVASGPSGHGSTPLEDSAPMRLQRALGRLASRHPAPRFSPVVHALAEEVGRAAGGAQGWVLRTPWATQAFATGPLLRNPLTRAMLTDTVNVTGFGGAQAPNVVPSEVWAQLDVRVLPDTTPLAVLAELEALVDDPAVRFEVLETVEPASSPIDDGVYQALVRSVRAQVPGAAVGPLIMMATTDSTFFRVKGVRAYGVALFALSPERLRGMHGVDERLEEEELGRGLQILLRAVIEVSEG
jgi:acetylornithine deacetylase/succinyl-diaminopimelate desuccinylase-like protein